MSRIAAYAATFLVFGIVDALWLTLVGSKVYRAVLGDLLRPDLQWPPAVLFYLAFPLGLVFFAVDPAAREASAVVALVNGALLGALAYATYDLTNQATLRNWAVQVTVMDIAYGAIASALAAFAGFQALRLVHGG